MLEILTHDDPAGFEYRYQLTNWGSLKSQKTVIAHLERKHKPFVCKHPNGDASYARQVAVFVKGVPCAKCGYTGYVYDDQGKRHECPTCCGEGVVPG